MTPEQFQKMNELYHEALALASEQRAAFLDEACAGDGELREGVEEMLVANEKAGSFMAKPVFEAAIKDLSGVSAPDMIGRQIGHYRILSQLGVGGMGEVYLARDMRLDRQVALKLLPVSLIAKPDQVRRFEQEARAASGLNHPNIITIYEIGKAEGVHFLAAEYVDGQTLRQRLRSGKLPVKEALDITLQTTGALIAAHAAGIVHRDIKPENIMVRQDGLVKILDFGLAKLTGRRFVSMDSQSPTLAVDNVKTNPGTVMGTVHYMSPEQALGKEVDHRADVFSLGVVLYELLTGGRPFEGDSMAAIFDSILNKAPAPMTDEAPEIVPELEHIVGRMLEKDREMRYQTVSDLRAELKRVIRALDLGATSSRSMSAPPWASQSGRAWMRSGADARSSAARRGWWKKAVWAAGVVFGLAGAGYFLWDSLARDGRSGAGVATVFNNATFTQLTDHSVAELFPSLATDGKTFVYASNVEGNWDIYSQRVGGRNSTNLTKDSTEDETQPAYSPDGELIAFRSERDGGGVFVMGATGESVRRVSDSGYHPAWSPDGKNLIYSTDNITTPLVRYINPSQVWRVNVATGEKKLLSKQDAVQPQWSPNNYRIAYWNMHQGGRRDIWTMPAEGGEPVPVTNDPAVDWNPIWSPDGRYIYFASDRGGSMNLWRAPIDEETGRTRGPLEPVTTPSLYSQHPAFSRDGKRLAYVQTLTRANIQQVAFDPVKETAPGTPTWVTQGSKQIYGPDLSPDGNWFAFDSMAEKLEDIFVIRRDGKGLRQLTSDIVRERGPRWSPDGKRLAFFSERSGRYEIWMINADGSGLRQITHTTGPTVVYPVWSPDGKRMVYSVQTLTPRIIEVEKTWGEQKPQPLPELDEPNTWFVAWSWSPDGKRLAGFKRRSDGAPPRLTLYSFDTGRYEQITEFGSHAVWLSDNRRLLFLHQGKIFLVDSQTRETREVLSASPDQIAAFGVSRNDRLLYYSLRVTEADIWLMTLD